MSLRAALLLMAMRTIKMTLSLAMSKGEGPDTYTKVTSSFLVTGTIVANVLDLLGPMGFFEIVYYYNY